MPGVILPQKKKKRVTHRLWEKFLNTNSFLYFSSIKTSLEMNSHSNILQTVAKRRANKNQSSPLELLVVLIYGQETHINLSFLMRLKQKL